MKKRALIVGISEYTPLLPNLFSAAFEARKWRDLLLQVYGFARRNVVMLVDKAATRSAITDRLMWLLGDSRPGDQLVFIFCGHGVRTPRPGSVGDCVDLQDEGLVPYPAGAADPRDVALFDDDLTALYCSIGIAPGARPTFIFDCCYSAGLDFAKPERTRKALVLPVDLAHCGRSPENFFRLALQGARSGVCTDPLVVASTGEYDEASEVPPATQKRSLFSSRAIETLRRNPVLTYQDLVSSVALDMEFLRQTPSLTGDPFRIQQQFFM
ncbi:MAG TPA: caspase family protein [Thermoanaerobaculia bacterium]|nr:caspase family protein [Thermoanaerobaculia bacterium]